jgi:hypothetical protein
MLLESGWRDEDQHHAGRGSDIAEAMDGAALRVHGTAMFGPMPLTIFKILVLAFNDEEGLIFMNVGVGRRASAGRRGLGEGWSTGHRSSRRR